MMRRGLLAVMLLPALAACTPTTKFPYMNIVDQRRFIPAGTAPDLPPKDLPPLPLVRIRFDRGDPDYTQQLATAVEAAVARKPDVEFNVVAPVATGQAQTPESAGDAAEVARAIAESQVPTDRIHVGVIEDRGNPPREISVYVR